eukprot:TRINITY_DN8699_c0_g1_i2.p2 TRINITY_DN8699_c0_g1~~TRINITY_DN8699_c0_g1_i2.p2  ORF type:complete len:111 (-),score=12.49 TRINITY_DN8699_c0_g1_i2:51-383(-)
MREFRAPERGPSVFLLLWWQTARQEHFLGKIVADTGNGLVLCKSKIGEKGIVADVGRVAVPLDVHRPLESIQIRMACSNILGLEMLELTVDVEPVTRLHLEKYNRNLEDP